MVVHKFTQKAVGLAKIELEMPSPKMGQAFLSLRI